MKEKLEVGRLARRSGKVQENRGENQEGYAH